MSREPVADSEISRLEGAQDMAAAVERVWGDALEARGVIHAVEVAPEDRGRYVALAGFRRAPLSLHGAWSAALARARADAILTTAESLRRQPELDHRPRVPGLDAEPLDAWRRERLRKPQPPVSLIYAKSEAPDLDHPVFRHWTRAVIFTSRRIGWHLESRAADCGVEVVAVDDPTLEQAVEFLRHSFGAATLAIETEPAEAMELYGDAPTVDEVMLSVCRSPNLPAEAIAAPFLSAEQLVRAFPESSKPHRVRSEDGDWSFHRFRR